VPEVAGEALSAPPDKKCLDGFTPPYPPPPSPSFLHPLAPHHDGGGESQRHGLHERAPPEPHIQVLPDQIRRLARLVLHHTTRKGFMNPPWHMIMIMTIMIVMIMVILSTYDSSLKNSSDS
jgi:hypothetical protein